MECSESFTNRTFSYLLFPTVFDVLLDVNNVGVRMKERMHTPHDFPRRRGRMGG